jgi:hypothetical protein
MNTKNLTEILLEPLRECTLYQPKFGTTNRSGISLTDFQELYGRDVFYHTLGLDIEAMYLAHKASGGITSIYRQLGIGCERVFRQILIEKFSLSEADVKYEYTKKRSDGSSQTLSLDAKIPLDLLPENAKRDVLCWIEKIKIQIGFDIPLETLRGCTFEVRQGYKSADSKRQNADIANALQSYSDLYVPIVFVFSNQVSEQVVSRYQNSRIGVLRGIGNGDPLVCSYAFVKEIIGFDLLKYLSVNSIQLQNELKKIIGKLVSV